MMEPPVHRRCARCGVDFAYAPGFYANKNLLPPRNCKNCRSERRARLVELRGRILARPSDFALVEAEGRSYFVSASAVAPGIMNGLQIGDAVTISVDPTEQPREGHRPHAFSCRALKTDEVAQSLTRRGQRP